MKAIARLDELLRRERAAAIAADLDALELLQTEKRACVDEIASDPGASREEVERVVTQARANTALLRQLADLHRALLGVETEPVYTARGRMHAADASSTSRVRRSL